MAVLLAEGGYQAFELGSAEWLWLTFSAVVAVLALVGGLVLMRSVLAADEGTERMQEVAGAIREGATAFLRRQYRTIVAIAVPVGLLVYLASTRVVTPLGEEALSRAESGALRTAAFLAGALLSGLAGYVGMSLAVRGNVRTAAAARAGQMGPALDVAFRSGGVTGLFTVGAGLLGATVIIMVAQNTATAVLVGFGLGGSLIALFMRVGGGIFTKAADVGADLVGKIEEGIPEDDPRNPATIADNVGDNVGDCAGMAADLFESYEVTLVAALILGYGAFVSLGGNPAVGVIFPLAIRAFGVLASMAGISAVRARRGDTTALAPINRGYLVGGVLTAICTFGVAQFYAHELRLFWAVVVGLVLAQVLAKQTQHFTTATDRPVRDVVESTRTGAATTVLSGFSLGLEASAWAMVTIGAAIVAALALGGGNIRLSLYLIALVGMGMLANTGLVVSEDGFGPVADNAAGIAEMSGGFDGEAEQVMRGLDAVGNTTKAITKGFAIGSAVIAAVALFASFIEEVGADLGLRDTGAALFDNAATQINVGAPKVFVGLLLGGAVVFLFSSLTIRAVGRTAGTVVVEVRRQFRERAGIMAGTERPDYDRVIDLCTRASQQELVAPALLAVLAPVIVGFGFGYAALGGFLAATILTGQLMAVSLTVSGGAWDNAKKHIEDGHEGGKGSAAHQASVIGDTVGDPFKDTTGPALNPLIKVMNLVSLLILSVVITTEGRTGVRVVVVAGAVAVVAGRRGLVPASPPRTRR